jgi:hypothetical protein
MKKTIFLIGFLYCLGLFSLQAQILIAKEKNNRYGYIDSLGKTIIPYEYPFVFTDTLQTIAFVLYDGKIKAINKHNDRLFTVFKYDNGPDYESDGLFRIIDDNSNRIGFANNEGQIIIQPTYFFVHPFCNGIATFNEGGKKETINCLDNYSQIIGGKWGFIDKQGMVVFPAIFDEVTLLQDQKIMVKIGEHTFLMIHKQSCGTD